MPSPIPQPPRLLSPLTVEDLTADLVWPRLMRAGALSLRPARIGFGFFYLFICMMVLTLARAGLGESGRSEIATSLNQIFEPNLVKAFQHLDATNASREIYSGFITLPWAIVKSHPLIAVPTFLALLLLTALFGGSISRTVATETAAGVSLSWPKALGFALTKLVSLAGALLIPLGIIWGAAIALSLAGGALFNVPGLNILGAVLFPLFLIVSLIAAVAALVFLFAHALLIPAVTCEGTDAIDAVQHAYSFVVSRPLRLLGYLLILVIQLVFAVFIVSLIVSLTLHFAHGALRNFGYSHSINVASAMPFVNEAPAHDALTGTDRIASTIINLFVAIVIGLLGGYVISYIFTASTLLYLAMRRVVDGQDMSEIWMPTMVPGTMARRTPTPPPAADAITDTGPADET